MQSALQRYSRCWIRWHPRQSKHQNRFCSLLLTAIEFKAIRTLQSAPAVSTDQRIKAFGTVSGRLILTYTTITSRGAWNAGQTSPTILFHSGFCSHAVDYTDQITVPYPGVVRSLAVTRSYTERIVDAQSRSPMKIEVIEGARHNQACDVRSTLVGAQMLSQSCLAHI